MVSVLNYLRLLYYLDIALSIVSGVAMNLSSGSPVWCAHFDNLKLQATWILSILTASLQVLETFINSRLA